MTSAASMGSSNFTVLWLAGFLGTHGPGEEVSRRLLLATFRFRVPEHSVLRAERFAHEVHAEQLVRQSSGIPHRYLHSLHGREGGSFVISEREVGACR